MLWTTAAKQTGKWYRGVVKAVDGFKARWHRAEAEKSWLRHAKQDAKKNGEKEKGRGGEKQGRRGHLAVNEIRKQLANRVARHQC